MKVLIAITTCNRLEEIQKNLIPFVKFCHSNNLFDFVLSLDGKNDTYFAFANKYHIPLLWSNEREGVGLSKNRILKQFAYYDYYYFIEDDVEIIDKNIFNLFIEFSKRNNIHHICSGEITEQRLIKNISFNNNKFAYTKYAGAYFTFYTKEGIKKVGGWHPLFAKYKRFGHTEHSMRFYHLGLSPAPFIVTESTRKYIILNDPPHVTQIDVDRNSNELIAEEQAMIDAKQTFFPITTLSNYYFNGKDVSIPVLHSDLQKGRYSLLKGKSKIKAWGNFYFHKFKTSKNPLFFILAIILYPNNNLLKHWIKQKIKK